MSLFMGLSAFQGVVGQAPAQTDRSEHADVTRILVDSFNPAYTVFTLETAEPDIRTETTPEGTFTFVSMAGAGHSMQPGCPQVPFKSCFVAVPNTQVSLEIMYQEYYEMDVGQIVPAQEPHPDSVIDDEVEFKMDMGVYNADADYPGERTVIAQTGMIRVVPFARLGFYPVQYNPVEGKMKVYTHIQVRLSWSASVSYQVDERLNSPNFFTLYDMNFVNWKEFEGTFATELAKEPAPARGLLGCEYLIITGVNYTSAANALADWKNKRGIDTWVRDTLQTGSTQPEIETYIQSAFNNWNPAPSYVLFLGDVEDIETNYVNVHPYHGTITGTDLWYFTLLGADYFPDMYYGRIPVDNQIQAGNYIAEIVDYEIDPPFQNTYYDNMTMAAYFQDPGNDGYEDRRFTRTTEEIRDYLINNHSYVVPRIYCTDSSNPTNYNSGTHPYNWPIPGEPLPMDLLKPIYPWDGDHDLILNCLNNGTTILNHRDHGLRNGWGDPHFQISDLANLDNADMLPIVFSINCETGWFDHETDSDGSTTTESFCEEFLRKDPGGCVGIFGASRVSYSGYNDFMCRGFYDAQFPDFDFAVGGTTPMYRMGEILNYGKYYMANHYACGDLWGYEELEFEIFHYFGDPTMEMYTAPPGSLTVTHPMEVLSDTTSVTVNCMQDGAFVTISKGEDVLGTGTVVAGQALVMTSQLQPGIVNVTVTKHNWRPYQGQITVIPNVAPWTDLLAPDSYMLVAGGDSLEISWEMGDERDSLDEMTVNLRYSTDNGATYPFVIASGLTGYTANPCTYMWDPLPLIDSTQVKVRVTVYDTYGWSDVDESQQAFEIDSTSPLPVTNVRAELEGSGVRVYWDASPSPDVGHYEVWWSMNNWDPTGASYTSFLDAGANTDVLHANVGGINPNSYFYQVKVFDLLGHETVTTGIQAAKFGSTQSVMANPSGWFLVGSSLVQSDTTIAHVIQGQGLPAFMDCLRNYDPVAGWTINVPSAPSQINTFNTISDEIGFWMHVSSNTRFATAGYVGDKAIDLKAGWNIVPYPFAQRFMSAASVDAHLTANCPNYGGMLIADYTQPYHLKVPTGAENIFHNQGFFVYATSDTVWTVANY
ncbi:MAG: hypothetical protein AYK23_03645 [Candidatus Proteinoplasmatales archaeon SG8-5]|nr:MAG: hypothetical protein AYK23_03645 [Candidatus Proteinoplasmatales archaeon SG8-5]